MHQSAQPVRTNFLETLLNLAARLPPEAAHPVAILATEAHDDGIYLHIAYTGAMPADTVRLLLHAAERTITPEN